MIGMEEQVETKIQSYLPLAIVSIELDSSYFQYSYSDQMLNHGFIFINNLCSSLSSQLTNIYGVRIYVSPEIVSEGSIIARLKISIDKEQIKRIIEGTVSNLAAAGIIALAASLMNFTETETSTSPPTIEYHVEAQIYNIINESNYNISDYKFTDYTNIFEGKPKFDF